MKKVKDSKDFFGKQYKHETDIALKVLMKYGPVILLPLVLMFLVNQSVDFFLNIKAFINLFK